MSNVGFGGLFFQLEPVGSPPLSRAPETDPQSSKPPATTTPACTITHFD